MASHKCKCCKCPRSSSPHKSDLPTICLIPEEHVNDIKKCFKIDTHHKHDSHHDSRGHASTSHNKNKEFKLLSEEYIKKNFKLPPRALYLDPAKRPLITFPMSGEEITTNFSNDRKAKINQAILDGILDSSAQICEPRVFPYTENSHGEKHEKKKHVDPEIILILQLPDLEHKCPVHNETVKTPRFIWHSQEKILIQERKGAGYAHTEGGRNFGGGPLNKPKPWLLSRHTDFDYFSQW